MSLINDMLNDLEKHKEQNKKKYTQPKKFDETTQLDDCPKETPDTVATANTKQPPVMPPADDDDDVTIITDSADNTHDNIATDSYKTDRTKTTNPIFQPNNNEKVSIPEEETPTQSKTKHQQPWESGQYRKDKPTNTGNDKVNTYFNTAIENKKSSQKRLVILIIVIAIACLVLACLYFWPTKTRAPLAQSTLRTGTALSTQPIEPKIEIQKDNQASSTETAASTAPSDKEIEASSATADNSTTASKKTTDKANNTTTEKQIDNITNNDQAVKVKPVAISPLAQAQTSYNESMANINNVSSYQAIEQMRQLLEQHPDFKTARTTLAAMLVKYGDSTQALHVLNQGLKQFPADKDMAELAAHILVEQGNVQQALRILKRAQPATIQSTPDYYALMAGLYIQEGDFTRAHNFYQALTKLNPQNGNWWAGLAISSEKLGLRQAAIDAYNQAETVGGLSPTLQAYIEQTMQGSLR